MFDKQKTKAVLWDLDDTLYSRVDAARQMYPGLLRTLLYTERSDAFIEEAADFIMSKVKRNSMIHPDAFDALLEKFPPDKPYVRSQCVDYYYAHLREFVKPSPEALEVVRKLREMGIKTAIVTNITPELLVSQKAKVKALGIAQLFDAVIYSAEFGVHKPDRRIFDHAAEILGVSNDQCVFVGDDPASDVAGALNADMEVVWLDRFPYDGRYDGNEKVHRVKSVKEYFHL